MKKFYAWFGAAAIVIVIFGTMYGIVQQSQRSAANYPQVQIAEDAANALNSGENPKNVTSTRTDIAKSLAAFVVIYDKSGQPVSGTAQLNGQLPKVPIGVLKASDKKEYSAVTWQPDSKVRIAAISVSARGYYVLSGRSLKEVEKNESLTLQIATFGGLLALALLSATYQINKILPKKS